MNQQQQNDAIKTQPWRLGLDIGTNSIGWAIRELESDGSAGKMKDAGVRIFSEGREPGKLTTLNASRRMSRGQRRNRDRYLKRRQTLFNKLVRFKLMPYDREQQKELEKIDPYEVRAEAAAGNKQELYRLGRAIFHLNQRRGFKSNRLTDKVDEKESGVISRSIKAFREMLAEEGCDTVGQLLYKRKNDKLTVRARRQTTQENYAVYFDRKMLEDEFNIIWGNQQKFHPQMTDEARESIHLSIFSQRPLKPVEVGKCRFMEQEDRCSWALPSAQLFRINQEVNNLQWTDIDGEEFKMTENMDLRDQLVEDLCKSPKKTFDQIRKILDKKGYKKIIKFNLESDSRKHLDGNKTNIAVCPPSEKKAGKRLVPKDVWHSWDTATQDKLIDLLESDLDDEKLKQQLMQGPWLLSEQCADNCLNTALPPGHSNLCLKVIKKLLPHLQLGLNYYEALKEEGYADQEGERVLRPELPYYAELPGLSVNIPAAAGDSGKLAKQQWEEQKYGRFTNPTVHIALGQLRLLINELIKQYGNPRQIVVEVGRDLPAGTDEKKKILSEIKKNTERNDRYAEELEKFGIHNKTRDHFIRLRLWDQIEDEPLCLYCGKKFQDKRDLFTSPPKIEVDHILPWSKTLDDGFNNKILCCTSCNRHKGNLTPDEAFSSNPIEWSDLLARVQLLVADKKISINKSKRFARNALEDWVSDEKDFLDRQLNDMRYISRVAKRYVDQVCDQSWTVPGHMTSLVRSIFRPTSGSSSLQDDDRKRVFKNRADHRNHMLDAVALTMADRSLLQEIATQSHRYGKQSDFTSIICRRFGYEGNQNKLFAMLVSLWDAAIVSHRVSKSRFGQLHDETAYGKRADEYDSKVNWYLTRSAVSGLASRKDIDKIFDERIRNEIIAELQDYPGDDIKQFLSDFFKNRDIKKLRIRKKFKYAIPVQHNRDPKGEPYYKYLPSTSNWSMEIYSDEKGKWRGECVRRYDANRRNSSGHHCHIPEWRRKYPEAKMMMRLFINSMLYFPSESDDRRYMRVQKLTGNAVYMAAHNEANVDARNRAEPASKIMVARSPAYLQENKAELIHISPSGRIMTAGNG